MKVFIFLTVLLVLFATHSAAKDGPGSNGGQDHSAHMQTAQSQGAAAQDHSMHEPSSGGNKLTGAEPAPSNGNVKKFHLYATDGYFTMPDGEEVYIWGYSLENKQGTATYPAPLIEVEEGDAVEITLTNLGNSKSNVAPTTHTIHFHGLDTNQANDGVPHTSLSIADGESFTYKFNSPFAGTYFYHCHADTIQHLQMGMTGPFIVKAKDNKNEAWTGGPAYDKESILFLNEFDIGWHQAVEMNQPYDRTDFKPGYWFVNNDTRKADSNEPAQKIEGKPGEKVLVRIVNTGYKEHQFDLFGDSFTVVATDGRPLPAAETKNSLLLGSSERYDVLVTIPESGSVSYYAGAIKKK